MKCLTLSEEWMGDEVWEVGWKVAGVEGVGTVVGK